MPIVFRSNEIEFNELQSDMQQYSWYSSPRLSEMGKSEDLFFNVRKLDTGKYSYPYHYHRNAEEVLLIISGSATLRTEDGLEIVNKGDILFFEKGKSSVHQLYNHTSEPCVYFDIRTNNGFDVAEFPDTNKLIIDPEMDIFERGDNVDYFKGEEQIDEIWKELKNK